MTLDNSVLWAWGIFLALAYLLTLAILPVLFGAIRSANRIARDARRTLPAAVGILNNTKAIAELDATKAAGGEILNAAQAIVAGATSIDARLAKLAEAR